MNKKYMYVIFIICLLFGFFFGYLTITNEKNVISEDITKEEATKIIDDFTIGYGCNNIEEYTNNKLMTNKDISNDRAFQVVEYLEFDGEKSAITLEEVKRKIALYFGDDYQFDPEKISNSCNLYGYDSNDKIFYQTKDLCVVNCSNTTTIYKVKDINKDNNYINIYVNVLFNSESESINYYKDYERINISDDNNINEGSLYLFKFKKIGSKYRFVSCEKSTSLN